jgi:hypothetical protein
MKSRGDDEDLKLVLRHRPTAVSANRVAVFCSRAAPPHLSKAWQHHQLPSSFLGPAMGQTAIEVRGTPDLTDGQKLYAVAELQVPQAMPTRAPILLACQVGGCGIE